VKPLIARHHRDPEDLCLRRLNQQQHRLLIGPGRTSGILIDDDFATRLSRGDKSADEKKGGNAMEEK
jgi:hypothetical protein